MRPRVAIRRRRSPTRPRRRLAPLYAAPFVGVTGEAAGLYRVADASLDGFEVYRGVDGAAIDFGAAPWQTAASLPASFAAPAAGHRYEYVVRRRNAWGLASLNVASLVLDLDGSGDGRPRPPSAPLEVSIEPVSEASVRITAGYAYAVDGAFAADRFVIYLRGDGTDPDPQFDVPYDVVAMRRADGTARLEYEDGSFGEGDEIRVIVRTRRSGSPDVDSTNVDVHSATTTFVGPAAPAGAAFLGRSAEQAQ